MIIFEAKHVSEAATIASAVRHSKQTERGNLTVKQTQYRAIDAKDTKAQGRIRWTKENGTRGPPHTISAFPFTGANACATRATLPFRR